MLGIAMHTTIETLYKKGLNKSQISRMLKIDRKTVRKVLTAIETEGEVIKKTRPSILDPHKEYIQIQANKGLTAKRIHQDLIRDFNFDGGYDTVKKYVKTIKDIPSKVYMVLHSQPGEEAQVDFGYIGTLKINNTYKKAWIFVMTLSYSRYMYVQIVFDQSVKTFIECHKAAFKYFGGIPQNIKIDNLKAGILETDFYEPVIQKEYAAFASYYGFWAEPCRVYTPTDKGKVESSVKYVKNNCFKGREFKDADEAKTFLKEWLDNIANKRIHGTTKKTPIEVFTSTEKNRLSSLPIEDFVLSHSSECLVNTNCHISYKGNYYSVPYGFIGQTVKVIEMNGLLRIFLSEKEIALHSLQTNEKGNFITDINHYPRSKNISIKDILSRQKLEMSEIGIHALEFYEKYLNTNLKNRKYDYRAISGVLSLRKKYDSGTINKACKRAITFNAISYKMIKNICDKGVVCDEIPAQSYVNSEATEIARSLHEYNKLLSGGVGKNE